MCDPGNPILPLPPPLLIVRPPTPTPSPASRSARAEHFPSIQMIVQTADFDRVAGPAPSGSPLPSPASSSATLISPGLPATPSPRGGGPRPPPVAVITMRDGARRYHYAGGDSANSSCATVDRSPRRPSLPISPASSLSLSPTEVPGGPRNYPQRLPLPQSPPPSPYAAICASCACHLDLGAAPPPPAGVASPFAVAEHNGTAAQSRAATPRMPTRPPTSDAATLAMLDCSSGAAATARMPTPPPEPALAPATAGRRRAHSGPVASTGTSTIGSWAGKDGGGGPGKTGGSVLGRRSVLRQLKARLRGKSVAGLFSNAVPPPPPLAPAQAAGAASRPRVSFPLSSWAAQDTSAYRSGGRQLPVVTVQASGPGGAAASRSGRRAEDRYVVVEHWAE